MAGEDSDLQFIRCPGCRSLVPAAASRCRMCGQLLEQRREEEVDPLVKKTRVRQRTMSVSEDEREEIKSRVEERGADAFDSEEGDPYPIEAEADFGEESDLPAHVVEVDEEPVSLPEPRSSGAPRGREFDSRRMNGEHLASPEEDEEDDLSEGGGDVEDEQGGGAYGEAGVEPGRKKRRRRRRKKKGNAVALTPSPAAHAGENAEPEEFDAPEPELEPEPEMEPAPVRSQPARFGWARPENGEAGRPHTALERPQPVRDRWTRPDTETPFLRDERARTAPEQAPEPIREQRPQQEPRMERVQPGPNSGRQELDPIVPRRVEPARSEPETVSRQEEEAPSRGAEVARVSGDLIGWLVTPDEYGRSVSRELRVGRYFVSRQRLRPTDIVFDSPSISMPHCLLDATADGVAVQDLMSERGTFVRRHGTEKFVRVENVGQIQHGDTVRFGEYDVLVCLVPRSGGR